MSGVGVCRPTRRHLLAAGPCGLLGALLAPSPGLAQETLPIARSLPEALNGALAKGKALVVLVSLDGCPHCRLVRNSYLGPLRRQGQPLVQLDMRSPRALTDFAGKPSTHGEVVKALGVRVAPTVLFFGRDGREAAARLEGVSIPDFYGAYLDERVEAANRSLKAL